MKRSLTVATAILFLVAATAFAQSGDQSGKSERPWAGRQKRAKLHERMEMVKMWKLTEALDLNEETAQKLFPLLNKYDEQLQQLREKRHDLIGQLNDELAKEKPDSAALQKMVDQFKKNEVEMVQTRNDRLDDLSKVLTEEQVAKLIVFVPRFERQMRHMIEDVRFRRRTKNCSMAPPEGAPECPLGNEPMQRYWGGGRQGRGNPPAAK